MLFTVQPIFFLFFPCVFPTLLFDPGWLVSEEVIVMYIVFATRYGYLKMFFFFFFFLVHSKIGILDSIVGGGGGRVEGGGGGGAVELLSCREPSISETFFVS